MCSAKGGYNPPSLLPVVVRSKIEVEEAPEPEEGEKEGRDGETVEAKNPIVGPVTVWIGVFPGYG